MGWVFVSLIPYLVVMRAIVGRPFGWMLALAAPMVLNNALVGQNGFLTAALIGGTLYLMPVRPVLAGICLGLLSYKPQYGLLFPLVLIAAGQWTNVRQRGCDDRAMALVSWLAFGTESWQAFFHWMPVFSQAFLIEGKAPWWKMQSLFALVRYFGGPEQLGWMLQWILTATVAVVLVVMWRSRVSYSLKAAALATGTLLITPYLFMYDMMVLAISVAFLVRPDSTAASVDTSLPRSVAPPRWYSVLSSWGAGRLGATLIVAALIMRRAAFGRRQGTLIVGGAGIDSWSLPRHPLWRTAGRARWPQRSPVFQPRRRRRALCRRLSAASPRGFGQAGLLFRALRTRQHDRWKFPRSRFKRERKPTFAASVSIGSGSFEAPASDRSVLPLAVGLGVYFLLLFAGNKLLGDPDTLVADHGRAVDPRPSRGAGDRRVFLHHARPALDLDAMAGPGAIRQGLRDRRLERAGGAGGAVPSRQRSRCWRDFSVPG